MVFLPNSVPMIASLWSILLSVTVSAQGTRWGLNSYNQTISGLTTLPQSDTAMLAIVGSIGGLLLFTIVMVIVIAAVQTHRHPEQYSPRPGGLGRPKQSRAKGLARAVLESIPIVKFGESNDKKADVAAHKDIELADTSQANCDQSTTTDANDLSTTRYAGITTSAINTNVLAAAAGSLSTTEPDIQARFNSLGCSICLEDFVKGEDVRVLPCSHQFHPICIDPWLLNISGTCPMW